MQVRTSFLSKEELEKVRIGWKCDLAKRPPKRPIDWKWRSSRKESK